MHGHGDSEFKNRVKKGLGHEGGGEFKSRVSKGLHGGGERERTTMPIKRATGGEVPGYKHGGMTEHHGHGRHVGHHPVHHKGGEMAHEKGYMSHGGLSKHHHNKHHRYAEGGHVDHKAEGGMHHMGHKKGPEHHFWGTLAGHMAPVVLDMARKHFGYARGGATGETEATLYPHRARGGKAGHHAMGGMPAAMEMGRKYLRRSHGGKAEHHAMGGVGKIRHNQYKSED